MDGENVNEDPEDLEYLNVINVRQSIHHIKNKLNTSVREAYEEVEDDRQWNLPHLKKIFKTKDLQDLFKLYTQRLNQSFFALLMLVQSGLFTVHFLIVACSASTITSNLLDLILYGFMACLSLKMFFVVDGCGYIVLDKKTLKVMSLVFFILLQVVNVSVPLYYYFGDINVQLRPAYTVHIIISCYVFFYMCNFALTIVFGLVTSIIHFLVLIFVTYSSLESSVLIGRIFSDVIEILCINLLGIYYRYLNEIIKRRSFLDRRACVIFNRHLKFQKQQEEQLMDTLIPSYVLENVRDSFFHYWESLENVKSDTIQLEYKTSFTQKFENVTILYADVVNYTEMTVKLNINELLETLNELFGNFDEVSERLKVLRIKFLGDCYYCVSGLPPDIPENHAEACVDLGLEMIKIIAEVRKKRNININMRIGVHTGKIISGVIGYEKIHFDIWSKDVSLANQMETEGEPGKVHVTQQTKDLLSKRYNIEPTEKGKTVPQFRQLGIETYLITPDGMKVSMEKKKDSGNIYVKNINSNTTNSKISGSSKTISKNSSSSSLNGLPGTTSDNEGKEKDQHIQRKKVQYYGIIETTYAEDETADTSQRRFSDDTTLRVSDKSDPRDSQRRTAFMNSNIKRYKDMMKETFEEMKENIQKLSLSKYQQWIKFEEINPLTLLFKKGDYERDFLKMHDPLFKYYLVSELFLVIFLYLIQNLTLSSWNWENWWIISTFAVITLFFLPLMWMNHCFKNKSNKILHCLAYLSRILIHSIWARLAIYLTMCVLFTLCVFSELINCRGRFTLPDNHQPSEVLQRSFLSLVSRNDGYGVCIVPWHMTQSCTLAIIMSFLFLRMIMWVKFSIASVITILYACCVWYYSDDIIESNSETYNYELSPKISHIMNVAFLTFTLHIIDRQTEYLNRLDYLWNQNLKDEQAKIQSRYIINKMLLNNVLPEHLADMYLDITRPPAALYHERYANAAVMFASIVVSQTRDIEDDILLSTMSEIIGDFDKLMLKGGYGHRIEKIKVAKWTYMAACGISPGHGDVEYSEPSIHVEALLRFASAMINQLNKISREHLPDLKLRIGISNGEIVAGVVGSKKPLYDIWGDPVNMASRMDTTGEPNKIQVLEHTANIIKNRGYRCTLRGKILVKGLKGSVPTYFVDLDHNFDLMRAAE